MQRLACRLALEKTGMHPEEIRYLFAGDLLRQGIATSMGVEGLQIPLIFPMVTPLIRTWIFCVPTKKAPLPVTVQLADKGLWLAYPRGKRNSFSALPKWLEVTAMIFSA